MAVTLTERAPRLLEPLRAPRRVLPVTLPLLALVLANVVVHTGGRHTGEGWTVGQQIFGGTYVWFTVLLFAVLWWRWRAAR